MNVTIVFGGSQVSNTDGFIEEVSEEVRKDKLFALYKKYAWIPVVVICSLVGGAGFLEYQKSAKANAASARGDALIAALNQDDASIRASELALISENGGDEAPIAKLHRAGVLLEQDDIAGSLAEYDSMSGGDDIYSQVAMLKAIMIRGNKMDNDTRMQALDAIATPGNAFRVIAMEQKAIAYIDMGNSDKAIEIFSTLIEEADVSQALIARSKQMILALGGELAN